MPSELADLDIPSLTRKVLSRRQVVRQGMCKPKNLEAILSKPPPNVEFVNGLETYLLDDQGNRVRRICGEPTNDNRESSRLARPRLPSFVPDGIANPHGVVNPYDEYRCTLVAGWGTGTGIGPCKIHLGRQLRGGSKTAFYEKLINDFNEGQVVNLGNLRDHLENVRRTVSIDELYDQADPLYRLLALANYLTEQLDQGEDFDPDITRQLADIVRKSADVKLTLAKFDQKMMKNKAIEYLVTALVNGILMVAKNHLPHGALAGFLEEVKEQVLIPIEDQGYTEMFLRQEAAGVHQEFNVLPAPGDRDGQVR